MLGFIISTVAFSLSLMVLNRYYEIGDQDHRHPHRTRVLLYATVISLGAGWVTDKLDGDAEKPQPSISDVVSSGDPALIAKMMLGIN